MLHWWTALRARCALKVRRRARRTGSLRAALVQELDPRLLLSARNAAIAEPALAASPNPIVPPLPGDVDLSQTFLLASRPSATKTIFLDFDGHTTSRTYWNSKYARGRDIETPAYSIDNDAAFSDIELATIQCIWQRVAEDFAPFDINVTTIEPSTDDLIKFGTGDERWGMRVNVGGSYNDWLYQAAGGIAVMGSFGKPKDTGLFVFTRHRGGEEKYTADCISHEVGHTLGLGHKGAPGSPYYSGHGSGDTGWAPLMGAAYNRALTQWSKGEYPNSTNRQDELKLITTGKGVNYRVDDYGSTRSSASVLPFTSGDGNVRSVQVAGVIERSTDQDWFAFATSGGSVNLDFQPASRGANLDLLASLYDASGTLVATSNPEDRIDAHFQIDLPPGVYYLMVDGVGARGLADGYSDYGSLGQYTVSGTIAETGDPEASGWITGTVWHDADRNGVGDQGIEGVTVFLDLDGDGFFDDANESSALTNDQGQYSLSQITAGDFIVRAIFSDAWLQIGPADGLGQFVKLTEAGLARNIDFAALNPPLLDDVPRIPVEARSRETLLAENAVVQDLDTTKFNGTRLMVQLTSGATAADRLFLDTGQITLARTSVRFRGKVVGTFTGGVGSTPLVVTFNASATAAAIQAVVQSVAWRSTGVHPDIAGKAMSLTLFESNGTRSNSLEKTLMLVEAG